MAVSESILSSWKTPFSTPIRKDENACRDLFQNSEKLLASAVSICRLKGSVECQTGGLITVCEELQSLIRLAFSEIRRLEKDFQSQRSQLEDEVTCLKERVKYLEEGKGASKPSDNEEGQKQNSEVAVKEHNDSRESKETVGNETDANYSMPLLDENLEESDPYIFNVGSTGTTEVSGEDPLSCKDQKASRSPQEKKKSNSKKRLKKLTPKKAVNLSNSMSGAYSVTEVDDEGLETTFTSASKKSEAMSPSDTSSLEPESCGSSKNLSASSKKERQKRNSKRSTSKERVEEMEDVSGATFKSNGVKRGSSCNKEMEENKQGGETTVVAEKSAAELPAQPELELKGGSKVTKEKTKTKKKKSSQDEMPADDANQQQEVTENKESHKKKTPVTVEESDDVFQEETPGNKAGMKSKEKRKDSPVHKKPAEKLNRKLSRNKKSKTTSDGNADKINEMTNGQLELENAPQELNPKSKASVSGITSTKKESPISEENDEPLGDMSFLINVNSQISVFVADASRDECELDPMTARERNDVYKVTQLYKLRARIGTKSENNLTTVRLSKQADTKMPKPGRVDRLLSELSIAASKQAVKDSPKNQGKRKHAATADGNEESGAGDELDQGSPPKKKPSKLSRTNKVRS